jgi:hypothetical protein
MERRGTWKTLSTLVLTTVVAGCGGTLPSGSIPATPTASSQPSGTPAGGVTPAETAAPTDGASSAPTATVKPTRTPAAPTPTPKPVKAHWDTLGKVASVPVMDIHAVRLGGGHVLFLAQRDDGRPYASAWDPSARKVRATAALDTPRSEYVALPLGDGRAIVVGGTNDRNQSYSSTWIYDAAGGGSWTKTGLLHQARSAPCAAVLMDGGVLVAGGYFRVKPNYGAVGAPIALAVARTGGFDAGPVPLNDVSPPFIGAAMATAELFDPATGTWSTTGAMRYARAGCQAATLADGRVLVVGSGGAWDGVGIDERAIDTAEIYDPKTGRFSSAGQLPETYGEGGSLVALKDGGAVLIGHTEWWKHEGETTRSFRYNTARNTWVQIGKTYIVRGDPGEGATEVSRGVRDLAGAAAALLPDGRVLVAGGGSAPTRTDDAAFGWKTIPVRAVLAYDPKTNRWQNLPSMPQARRGDVVITMADGSVIVAADSFLRFTPAR